MSGAASESAAAPVSHNAADPVELNDVCRTKLIFRRRSFAEFNSSIRFGT